MSSAVRMGRGSYEGQVRRPSSRSSKPPPNSDFVEFVHRVLDIAFTPITFPIRVIRDFLTSPLTISLAIKGILAVLLVLASAAFSTLAVGAFWWSWGIGGNVEVEGWLLYGSRAIRTPHVTLQLPLDRFQEDLPYDVQVELELVRPAHASEEMGNFMVALDLRSLRAPDVSVVRVAQPSLPPPPLPAPFLAVPTIPSYLIPPCIIPWPFRSFCPSRLFGYAGSPNARIKERRRRGRLVSPARGKEVVLLTKELIEGAVINPGRGDMAIGSAFVSIGREDTNSEEPSARYYREVRTTGWVVVRFIPHPTGLRRLLIANFLPPLIILPPVSLSLTIASALIGFLVISCMGKRTKTPKKIEDTSDAEKEKERKREKRRSRQGEEASSPRRLTDRDAEAKLATLDRVWDAQLARDQARAWDAAEARLSGRRPLAEPFEVVQVVEHQTPRSARIVDDVAGDESVDETETVTVTETETDATLEPTMSGQSGATGATDATTRTSPATGVSGSVTASDAWSSSDNWDGSDDQRY